MVCFWLNPEIRAIRVAAGGYHWHFIHCVSARLVETRLG